MTGQDRIIDILNTIKKIQESKQPIKQYFKNLIKYYQDIILLYSVFHLVTSNGKSSRVNRAKGNDLEFLSGYNINISKLKKIH